MICYLLLCMILNLYSDESIILPVDKGNAAVTRDEVEYSYKMSNLICNGSYYKVKMNSTLKTKRKLSQTLCMNKDLIPQMAYRQLTQHYSKLLHIYSFPNIHKDGIPLTPIVKNRGSACHLESSFLMDVVTPLTSKSSSYVKNSAHFIEKKQ